MLLLDALMKEVRSSGEYNVDAQSKPACILWPDGERQWEKAVARLQLDTPELFVLGPFDAKHRMGPAIWLRCVLAHTTDVHDVPDDRIPILYLPGVSRQDLRTVENCRDSLKPIVELQYRGALWSQESGKDWTVLAFLKASRGGLRLDVAQDATTRDAMQQAIVRLLDEDLETLRGRHLDAEFFQNVLTGGDPDKNVLLWMDQGDVFKSQHTDAEWHAFLSATESKTGLNPDRDGSLSAAAQLATHDSDAWKSIWERFCEAPGNYGHIPDLMRQATMPPADLFADTKSHGGWPQWNDAQETVLRAGLATLKDATPAEACKRIIDLELSHAPRRSLPWCHLGLSPLANALAHLATLAEESQTSLAVGDLSGVQTAYEAGSWQVDGCVLEALASVRTKEDTQSVTAAIRSVYLPWVQDAALHLQQLVREEGYPAGSSEQLPKPSYHDGECLLFVDGLRFDLAKRLRALLEARNLAVAERALWAPLPSITATGKPAVTPVRDMIAGGDDPADFNPIAAESKKKLTAPLLRKMLADRGWSILTDRETGTGQGHAWCEDHNIDSKGHDEHAQALASEVGRILEDVRDRVTDLLNAGWRSVRIVTDHGWLLMPQGLPAASLPAAVVDSKWGRCASVKAGAIISAQTYPWFWNPVFSFVLADGISCYRAGTEYAHGGLSVQECLTLELTATAAPSEASSILVHADSVEWRGMRCTVTLSGMFNGLMIDLRMHPGDAHSTIISSPKLIGKATESVLVQDETLEGNPVFVVLMDVHGQAVAQYPTVVGGGKS